MMRRILRKTKFRDTNRNDVLCFLKAGSTNFAHPYFIFWDRVALLFPTKPACAHYVQAYINVFSDVLMYD